MTAHILSLHFLSCKQQDRPVNTIEYILSSRFPTGQQQDKPINMTEYILSLFASSLASSRRDHPFPLSPQESTPNLWTIGVWKIILSSFIFHSKPRDPRRNKLDIFNSCFDFSILIPVLTTASQLLLWLRRLYSFSTLPLLPSLATYSTRVSFVSSS